MGVWALTGFCGESTEASRPVNLTALSAAQVAAGQPRLTLIVDGLGFFHRLFEAACPGWEWMLGGNYPALAAALEDYVSRLRKGGVELCVTLDPARGTDDDESKDAELERRFRQRCEAIGAAMELLHGGVELHADGAADKHRIDWQMPQLCTKQAVCSLRKLGVQLVTCEREADALLASILEKTPGAYAIAGQDSDFFLMSGVRYLPLEFLSIEDAKGETVVTGKVFTAETVAAALGLPASRLFELAWLVGNDHSSDLLDEQGVPAALGIPTVRTKAKGNRSPPKDVASFLSQLPEGTPLSQRLLALGKSEQLIQSLEKCREFYSGAASAGGGGGGGGGGGSGGGREGSGAGGDGVARSALEELLCTGLHDATLPSWVLAVHRRRVYFSSVKTESMYPDCESEMDLTLRPLRRMLFSLLVAAGEGGVGGVGGEDGGGNHQGPAVVAEFVRVGHERVKREVETVSAEVLAEVLGSADLAVLRASDARDRRWALHLLVHMGADPKLLALDAFDRNAMGEDALLNLSDSILTEINGEFVEVPYQVYGVILRVFLLVFGTRAAAEQAAGGDFETVVHVGAWEYECLLTCIFLLSSRVDVSSLPPITPSAHTVHVASLFVCTVSAVTSAAQLLGLDDWTPEPAQIFAGRLFAHLHTDTPEARVLLSSCGGVLPSYEMGQLSSAILSIFVDCSWLLHGGASENMAFEQEETDESAPALLGLQD